MKNLEPFESLHPCRQCIVLLWHLSSTIITWELYIEASPRIQFHINLVRIWKVGVGPRCFLLIGTPGDLYLRLGKCLLNSFIQFLTFIV